MSNIYVVHIWGVPYSCHYTKEEAIKAGTDANEPTDEDGDGECTCSFTVEEWPVGQEIENQVSWGYEIPYNA